MKEYGTPGSQGRQGAGRTGSRDRCRGLRPASSSASTRTRSSSTSTCPSFCAACGASSDPSALPSDPGVPCVLTLYRRFGQGKKGGFLRLFFSRCGEGCTAGGGAVRSEHGSILCDAGSRLKCGCGLSGEVTSYLSIDSSRSSDGLKGLSRSETQCGVRGTERAVICVATFERWLGAIHSRLQDARGHRFQMGCSQHRASGASRGFAAYTGRALDVFARVARLGVLSRRLIFLATRFIASARSAWLWALARSPRVLSWAWEPGS